MLGGRVTATESLSRQHLGGSTEATKAPKANALDFTGDPKMCAGGGA